MKGLWSLVMAGALALTATATVRAGDGNPPDWRGQPGTTVQGWDFVNGGPQGQSPTLPHFNPFGPPQFTPGPNTSYGPIFIPDPGNPGTGTTQLGWTVGPGGWLEFMIPNQPSFTTGKEVWVQIKYSGVTPQIGGEGFFPGGTSIPGHPPIGGPTFTPGPGAVPGTSEYTLRLVFDINPQFEIIRIFNGSTFQPMHIYQVVIDTICPAPGTAAAGLLGIGLMASRRRR